MPRLSKRRKQQLLAALEKARASRLNAKASQERDGNSGENGVPGPAASPTFDAGDVGAPRAAAERLVDMTQGTTAVLPSSGSGGSTSRGPVGEAQGEVTPPPEVQAQPAVAPPEPGRGAPLRRSPATAAAPIAPSVGNRTVGTAPSPKRPRQEESPAPAPGPNPVAEDGPPAQKKPKRSGPSEMVWHKRLAELRAWQAEHGNCNVFGDGTGLHGWVQRLRLRGRAALGSQEKERVLDGLGFDWAPAKRGHHSVRSPSDGQQLAWDDSSPPAACSAFVPPASSASASESSEEAERPGDGEANGGEGGQEEPTLLPPRPVSENTCQPELYAAFQELDEARKTKVETYRAAEDAWSRFEEARRLYKEALHADRAAAAVMQFRERAVVDTEARRDCKWNRMFEALVAFKEEHGHCLVPVIAQHRAKTTDAEEKMEKSDLAKLSTWVSSQRKAYRRWKEKGDSALSTKQASNGRIVYRYKDLQPHRIRALEKLGFVWNIADEAWARNVSDLLEYKSANGDCAVPFKYPPNKKLGWWVAGQRQQYRLRMEGKPNEITDERIAELESIGFIWRSDFPRTNRTEKPRKLTEAEDWEECYALLVEFQGTHGNRSVNSRDIEFPQKHRLSAFVAWQRKLYRLFKAGQSCFLTQERIDRLDRIGFDWTPLQTYSNK